MLIETKFSDIRCVSNKVKKISSYIRIEDIKINSTMRLCNWEKLCERIHISELNDIGINKTLWDTIENSHLRIGRIIHSRMSNSKILSDICHIKNGIKIPIGSLMLDGRFLTLDKELKENKYDITTQATESDIQEMISKLDIEQVKTVLAAYARKEKRFEMSNKATNNILRRWAVNKFPIYNAIGRNISIKQSKEMPVDPKEIQRNIDEVKNKHSVFGEFMNYLSDDCIKENVCKENQLIQESFEEYKVGMKFTKFIARLFKNPQLDIDLSKVLQCKTELVNDTISIHPIDYLTMSYNKHSWNSCHELLNGGYKDAVFSYMFDNVAIMAFRCSNKTYTYKSPFHNDFEWNSKKERAIAFLNTDNCTIAVNQSYPSNVRNADLSRSISEFISTLLSKNANLPNSWKYIYKPHKESITVKNNGGEYYDPVDSLLIHNEAPNEYSKINIGSKERYCLCCGNTIGISRSLCDTCISKIR